MRLRPGVFLGAVLVLLAPWMAGEARAAAEVHKLSLVLSGMPTQVATDDFNDVIDTYNKAILTPKGYEGLGHLQFSWAFGAEMGYFVRPNFAVNAGLSQLRVSERKEFLPALSQGISLRAEVLTVPVHVGAAYYLQPYNQGDFQARMFFGAGMVSYTYTRATFEQVLTNPDSILFSQFGPSFKEVLTQDSPGYYLEGGAHMFFASHYSVLVSLMWRSGELRNMQLDEFSINGVDQPVAPGTVVNNPKGTPMKINVGGLGVGMAVAIGF